MEALPDENTLKPIEAVSDDIEEQLEKLRNRELLPADVLIALCDKVFLYYFVNWRQKKSFEKKTIFRSFGALWQCVGISMASSMTSWNSSE